MEKKFRYKNSFGLSNGNSHRGCITDLESRYTEVSYKWHFLLQVIKSISCKHLGQVGEGVWSGRASRLPLERKSRRETSISESPLVECYSFTSSSQDGWDVSLSCCFIMHKWYCQVTITIYVLCSSINCYCVRLFCDISENSVCILFQGHVNSCTNGVIRTVYMGHSMRSAGKWCILRIRITRMDTEMRVKAIFINTHPRSYQPYHCVPFPGLDAWSVVLP